MSDYEKIFNLSYWRVMSSTIDNLDFFHAFYTRFTSSSNRVLELFSHTDLENQIRMLQLSLIEVSSFNLSHGPDTTMKNLALRHRELNVDASLYGYG